MKRYLTVLLLCIFAVIAFTDCTRESAKLGPDGELFLTRTQYGFYKGNLPLADFPKYESQTSRSLDGSLFRLQRNNLSKVIECRFSNPPAGQKRVSATITFEGIQMEDIEDADFYVVKEEPGRCWCWNGELKIGIITFND